MMLRWIWSVPNPGGGAALPVSNAGEILPPFHGVSHFRVPTPLGSRKGKLVTGAVVLVALKCAARPLIAPIVEHRWSDPKLGSSKDPEAGVSMGVFGNIASKILNVIV